MRITILVAGLLFVSVFLVPLTAPSVQATALGIIRVSGTNFTINGSPMTTPLVGVDETTAVAMAIRAHVSGLSGEYGKNMNFPVPNTGKLNVNNLTQLWYAYFWFCAHYSINLVRFSSGDYWGTKISYEAWRDHPTQYFQVLDEMLKQAYYRGVYVELNMAGGIDYQFGATDHIYDLNRATGKAYHNYLDYMTATIAHLDASPYTNAIFAYDVNNEPDGSSYWAHDQVKFRTWARVIANDTTPLTTHIVDMGVGGGGDLAGNFGWGLASFQNSTGLTGFDICHHHAYFSAEDDYLVRDPLHWSTVHCGKPYFQGEIGKSYYSTSLGWVLVRWPWWEAKFLYYGGMAYCTMVLTGGTSGYPYSGDYPIGQQSPPPIPPSISISADVNYGTVSLHVQFASVVGNGTAPFTYAWVFDDGGSSTSANPSHIFTVAGTYHVYCTVNGGGTGTSNTITVVTYIPTPVPPPPPPTPPPLPPTPPPVIPGPIAGLGVNDTFILTSTYIDTNAQGPIQLNIAMVEQLSGVFFLLVIASIIIFMIFRFSDMFGRH